MDGRDALRFTYVPNGNIYFTPYMSEDDEWIQADYVPSYFDADEFHASTLVAALVEVAAAYHNEGLVAVNPDDDAVVQLYSEA